MDLAPMSDKQFTAIMVSETHWDRAWYVPFQVFRLRLVRLVDRLLDILERDQEFRCFMLDGQTLPIEDYLEIRPERRGDLERLVRAGRLQVGPWYVLADEYLVSPEALIRNLMIGMRMAGEFGEVMREGYVPDAFGHIGQLPQILDGFGIKSAVFWRGVGDEGEELGNEFWWQAPDGTRVLAVHLRDGYHNTSNLGYPMRWGDPSAMEFNPELAMQQARQAIDVIKPYAHTRYLLLMNGIDHSEAEPLVPEIIAQANEELPDVHIEHSSLPDFIARVRTQVGDDNLPTFQGEFNRGRYAVILQGVYSTRIYLKQANDRVQTLLESYAEPLSAWAWLLGADYPAAFLDAAWRKLLKNHPHDDICGCSADDVHREMMTRFGEAEQIGSTLTRDSYRGLIQHVDRTAQSGVLFVLYNPAGWPRTEATEVSLHFDRLDNTADDFRLVNADGQPVACQILSYREHFDMEVLKANRKHEVRTAVRVDDLPACGYRVYYAQPGAVAPEIDEPVQLVPNGMENQHLRVEIGADGSLDILDKATGQRFQGLGYFSDDEDAGDEYDYSPCANPANVASLDRPASVQVVHAGPLQVTYQITTTLSLPVSLTEDRRHRSEERIACPITTQVTMRWDSRVLDVRTTVNNRARDHRLRVCFPTDIQADQAVADGHFDVISHPIDLPATQGRHWEQPLVPTHHQRHFVDVSEGQVGLAVFNRGLPEYEVLRDGGRNTVAVTLLRCVDSISRGGLLSRPEHAGMPCPAPEGQCQGEHTFEYAIYPHAGDWQAVYRAAYTWHTPALLRRADEQEGYLPGEVWTDHSPDELTAPVRLKEPDLSGDLPSELSFLALEPDTLILSAVKQGERGDSLVLRFYNPTPEAVRATVTLFRPIRAAQLANLNEEAQADLPVDKGGQVSLEVKGKQVRTLALRV
jgi:mannosylglycerate hydrolase